jgi:hypothetical protein
LLVWGLAGVAFLLMPLYFINYQKITARSAGIMPSARTCLEFLSSGFGQEAGYGGLDRLTAAWPAFLEYCASGAIGYPFSDRPEQPVAPVLGAGLVLLALASTIRLARVWYQQPRERLRALGLFCFLGAMALFALGIGKARSGFGPGAGYEARYAPLAMPLLCGLYFVWEVYGGPVSRRIAQTCLVVPLVLLWPLNAMELLRYGKEHRATLEVVERDVRNGKPAREVAIIYAKNLNDQFKRNRLAAYMNLLRRAGIGPFRHLGEGPDVADPEEAAEERRKQLLARDIRKVVQAELPADAMVLVVSSNDRNLLELGGQREGWHFPHIEGGTASAGPPDTGAEAIAQLESLRQQGAQFLLFPEPAFWWLDKNEGYPEFQQHLEKHYRKVVGGKDTCIIFDLR